MERALALVPTKLVVAPCPLLIQAPTPAQVELRRMVLKCCFSNYLANFCANYLAH
jgi:hypothetical protein